MIKLIIFDLDGVLVDSRPLHYEALNKALEEIHPKYVISYDEHIAKYDGLSTTQKLTLLTKEKGLPSDLYSIIWKLKQDKTFDVINNTFTEDYELMNMLRTLKERGFLLYCASNSIWNTIKLMLLRKGILEYFDYFISNEEVKNAKPYPEIYLQCISRAKLSAHEVLICEDSPIGREAALKSGAHLCPVQDPKDLTLKKIYEYIKIYEEQPLKMDLKKWNKPLNVVIPMAGFGSRFANAGYVFPKPLIEVSGKPMIQVVVENINVDAHFIFIVQKDHFEKFALGYMLNQIAPGCDIIQIEKVTEGAACTVLLAKQFIDNDVPLLIANSDQYLEWSSSGFLHFASSENMDGCISTFYSTHPKWSFAKIDDNGYVTEVQEKKPISTIATTGIYYWTRGSDYVRYAEQMISKNIRVNNEFYVCPVYNEAIADGKKFKIHNCSKFWGIGTPDDLNFFLNNYDLSKL